METILIRDVSQEKLETLKNEPDIKVIDHYGRYVLLETIRGKILELGRNHEMDRLENRNELSVKGHSFNTNEGYPDFDEDLMIDGYEKGEKGIYIVDMMGPVNPEWREELESMGVEIINYQPNYAYEVVMTPEQADQVEEMFFVDWVGIYQPGFKLAEDLEPGSVSIETVDGSRVITEVKDEADLKDFAKMNEVYYISNQEEFELHDEMATQIIGGGCWIYDDDDDPDTAYRAHGNYGSHANQVGYDGSGVTVAVADTGLGDGTTPDAGHDDFTGRVVGGYTFTDDGSWQDDNGHGTHTAGSAVGDTYNGRAEKWYEDYYKAQGSAPESDLFAVRIFDANDDFVAPNDYREIVYVARENSDAYTHSNSWGSDSQGAYGDSDSDYDEVVRDAGDGEPMVITVSAGNAGDQSGTTGSPGNAKNVITVGAQENYNPPQDNYNPNITAEFSSRGWTEDNRVKPTVTAPGGQELSVFEIQGIHSTAPPTIDAYPYQDMAGTSMSNPAVNGAAAVVVDWYESIYGTRPNPSMVKALLINTAWNIPRDNGGENGPHIPNQDEGWGMVDLHSLVEAPVDFMLEDETSLLETGQTHEYDIEYQDASEPLNITLTWSDQQAASGDDPTLKNDLNLEVVSPSGAVYRGNNLVESWAATGEDTYDAFDSSGDGWDDTNVEENVYIHPTDLEDGTYTVRVHGFDVPADANGDGTANQDYSLVKYNAQTPSGNTAPSVNLTRPDGGETFTPGTTETIWWNMSDSEDANTDLTVDLYYSNDSGGSWNTIDTGIAGTADPNSYDWTVPNDPSTNCLVRVNVTDTNGATSSDQSASTFTIENTAPTVDLTQPDGGEVWTAGEVQTIWWNMSDSEDANTDLTCDLYYSNDSGGSWNTIDTGIAGTADPNSYDWTVPNDPSTNCLVRVNVTDTNGATSSDQSASTFTIEGVTGPTIEITKPNGGESWDAGTDHDITWNTTAGDGTITGVTLEYTSDGGGTWNEIVANTTDDGIYTWTVPDDDSTNCLVRGTVYDDNNLSDSDTSDDTFEINGIPPGPPENLTVEHYGVSSQELVTNGNFSGNYDDWTLTRPSTDGTSGYDGTETNTTDGSGSVQSKIELTGSNGEKNTVFQEEGIWNQSIGPTSNEVTVNGAYNVTWASTQGTYNDYYAQVNISLYDTGTGVWQNIYSTDQITDSGGWSYFGPNVKYTPSGQVNEMRVDIQCYIDTGGGSNGPDGKIYGWADDVSVYTAGSSGTEDNIVNWTASPDDGAGDNDVDHYNIYRSDVETGPWDSSNLYDSVVADGSTNYSYIDPGAGTADDTIWWYVVRAVDEDGLNDTNENSVPEPGVYNLTINSTTGGNVTVPGEGTFTYSAGSVVDLEAVADDGYYFVRWSGENETIDDATANQTTITMNDTYNISAEFSRGNYTLTINSTAGGYVAEPGEGTFEYAQGTLVDLEAIPDEGYYFVEWTGDNGTIGDTTANQTTIEMQDNYSITAEFEINTYYLNVTS
ncbi:MAG: S8 family serine peptidase, partial [Candidatus Aenigmatarchaeota archaeon]